VKSPELEILPADVDHVTAVFELPVTIAVNCWVVPDRIEVLTGETETETDAGGVLPETVTVAD
jgi:hypothetical protein